MVKCKKIIHGLFLLYRKEVVWKKKQKINTLHFFSLLVFAFCLALSVWRALPVCAFHALPSLRQWLLSTNNWLSWWQSACCAPKWTHTLLEGPWCCAVKASLHEASAGTPQVNRRRTRTSSHHREAKTETRGAVGGRPTAVRLDCWVVVIGGWGGGCLVWDGTASVCVCVWSVGQKHTNVISLVNVFAHLPDSNTHTGAHKHTLYWSDAADRGMGCFHGSVKEEAAPAPPDWPQLPTDN